MTKITRFMVVLAAGCLMAQAPIGIGPGRLVQSVLLSGAGHTYGDTAYCSAWIGAANTSNLPVPAGLPVICTSNDGINNIRLFQLDTLNWGGPTVNATLVNGMSSYGTESATNAPSGWWSYCTQTTLGTPPTSDSGQGCSWKNREPLARGGCLYLPVERQVTGGSVSDHDATIVKSCDAGKTWLNPYSLTHSGTPDANGDAPKPMSDVSYPGSIMWLMPGMTNIYNWSFIQYGRDGALPTVGGGCDPSVYACSILGDGSLARVPNASILDVTTWQYYSGRITANNVPSGDNSANWTSLFNTKSATSLTPALGSKVFTITAGLSGLSNGRRVYARSQTGSAVMEGLVTDYTSTSLTVNVDAYAGAGAHTDWNISPRTFVFEPAPTGGDGVRVIQVLGAPVYMPEFKSYLLAGYYGTPNTVGFMAAPQPWGPWKTVYNHNTATSFGFPALSLGLNYTVVSTNPPIVRITNVTNGPGYAWTFTQWEFVLGMQPYGNGEVSAYTDIGIKKLNSGWVFGSGETPGAFNRNGLVWAFDFMDHGGDTGAKYPYFHDVANNATIMYPCYSDGALNCGIVNNKGLILNTNSVSVQSGYLGNFQSRAGDLATGGSVSNLNAPNAMTGNGTYSLVGVFRKDTGIGAHDYDAYWSTGTNTSTANSVCLLGAGDGANEGKLDLSWGSISTYRYRFLSQFIPTTSSWYFIGVTVKANGTTPIAHMWVGDGGVLVDKIAGVSRTVSGGAPTQTPNVSAGPFVIGTGIGHSYTLNSSVAGLLIYDRALSATECQGLYQTFKTKLSARGIVVQ